LLLIVPILAQMYVKILSIQNIMDKILSPIKQRILQFVDFKQVERKNFFGELNVATSNFRGNALYSEVGGDVIAKILSIYPELNAEWLLTGNGKMLKSEGAPEKKIKFVEGRKVVPEVVVVDDADNDRIPLVPIKAQAGYLTGYDDPVFLETLPTYSVPDLNNGIFRMFEVDGLSMMPTLQDGSYVVGQFVENWEWLSNDRVCVVVTDEEGIVVKRVSNRIRKNNTIVCRSDNRAYPNLTINIENIKEIWECKMQLSFDFSPPSEEYQTFLTLEKQIQDLLGRMDEI
jgi:transcriptional regulator